MLLHQYDIVRFAKRHFGFFSPPRENRKILPSRRRVVLLLLRRVGDKKLRPRIDRGPACGVSPPRRQSDPTRRHARAENMLLIGGQQRRHNTRIRARPRGFFCSRSRNIRYAKVQNPHTIIMCINYRQKNIITIMRREKKKKKKTPRPKIRRSRLSLFVEFHKNPFAAVFR